MSQTKSHYIAEWALHGLPAAKVKAACSAFASNHLECALHPEVVQLASMGGKHPGNLSRTWKNSLRSISRPQFTEVEVPIYNAKAHPRPKNMSHVHTLVTPDDWLSWMYRNDRKRFGHMCSAVCPMEKLFIFGIASAGKMSHGHILET